ncbi:hypothetical protein [Streptomyces olivaceus]|uniref:hypothetical protein n=1 Tax=Streptomyces olivaceus TaxID=47716 RepID=UPI0040576FA5
MSALVVMARSLRTASAPASPPAGAVNVEAVGDEVPGCAFDDAGGDRPAGREGLTVVEEFVVVAQGADARIDTPTRLSGQPGLIGLHLKSVGGLTCLAVQDGQGMAGDPFLDTRIAGGPGRGPQFLQDVGDVDDDVDVDAVKTGLGPHEPSRWRASSTRTTQVRR